MRHPRTIVSLVVIAALATACSSAPGGGSSEPSSGAEASASAAPSAGPSLGGGGGGGGGANGSITYQITGDAQATGELPFFPLSLSIFDPSANGWVAYFLTQDGANSVVLNLAPDGQIFLYTDGTLTVTGVSDPSSETGCTFNVTKNDAGGTAGRLTCTSALVVDGSGALKHAAVTAHWDAHP